jgi:hypothetical protein
LREDRSDVRVGVPSGAVCTVGEIAREERVRPATWVACLEENVMEDVRDLDRHVRVFYP